jgi:hypothetical protein
LKIGQLTTFDIKQPTLLSATPLPEDEVAWQEDLLEALAETDIAEEGRGRPLTPRREKKPQTPVQEQPTQYWLQQEPQRQPAKMGLGQKERQEDTDTDRALEKLNAREEGRETLLREEKTVDKKAVPLKSVLSSYGEKAATQSTQASLPQAAAQVDNIERPERVAAAELPSQIGEVESKQSAATSQTQQQQTQQQQTQQEASSRPTEQQQTNTTAASSQQQALQQSILASLVSQNGMSSELELMTEPQDAASQGEANSNLIGVAPQQASSPNITNNPSKIVQSATAVMPDTSTEEVLEKLAQLSSGSEKARIVVGEGEDRVSLLISSTRQQVQIKAEAASTAMAQAMQSGSSELREALSQHGIELSQFSTSTSHDGTSSQARERQEAEEQVDAPATVQETAHTARPGVRVVV